MACVRAASMRNFVCIFLMVSHSTFGQMPLQQTATPFDTFINRPDIEWAAYINDTITYKDFNLNKRLIIRVLKNQSRASLPVGCGSPQALHISYLNKKEILHALFFTDDTFSFDSSGNMIRKNQFRLKTDTASFTKTDLTQILYIQNGQLISYIPWVAVMFPVITSTGNYLGDGDCFSTCFNFNYKDQPGKKEINIPLSLSRRKIRLDSFDVKGKLKELYGRNLLETLWPYILKNKIRVYSAETGKILKPGDINTDLVNEEKIQVPVYDSTGNLTGHKFIQNPLFPDSFTSAELVQDWYYNETRNWVFNKIRELYFYAKKWTAAGEANEATAILKIVVN